MKKDSLVYFFAFFAITLGVLLVTQDLRKAPEPIPDCQHIIDSLHDEVFNAKVEAGRYESTLEYLQEIDPEAAKKCNEFLEHETE